MLKYKGYSGDVRYDDEAKILHGEVINIKAVLTFQARNVDEIETAFHETIDDYLDWCRERGKEPEKPFSGHLLLRISPSLHELIYQAAQKSSQSLNAWIMETLTRAVGKPSNQTLNIKILEFLDLPIHEQSNKVGEGISLIPGPLESVSTFPSLDSTYLKNLHSIN